MRHKTLTACLFACFVFGSSIHCQAGMRSEKYQITTSTMSGGGGAMGSTDYHMSCTLGQPTPLMNPVDPPFSTSYDLYPGFWYTLDAAFGGCWWDIEPALGDGDVDGLDLFEFLNLMGDETDFASFAEEFGKAGCF